jgi:hypothetical protein
MQRRAFFPALAGSLLATRVAAQNDDWKPLFNGKDLGGWYTFLPSSGKDNDPKKIFKVEDGMLHIFDIPVTDQNQENGYIATTAEYSNCRLHAEYKWGGKRYPPRLEARRDSGIMYFIVGEDRLFPTSAECQLLEGDVGDLNIVGNASATAGGGGGRGGTPQTTRRVVKDANFEVLDGWNTIEIVMRDNTATQLVNGRIVSRAANILHWDAATPEQTVPLNRGRVLLQAYGAEIWFRNLKWKPL